MVFFDTESVSKTGPLVLIQWLNFPDGDQYGREVYIHEVWKMPIFSTLSLIESFTRDDIIGFNLVHDWFVLTKWYNILNKVGDKNGPPNRDEVRRIEAIGPQLGDCCLKPRSSCDLMLRARSGGYQYLAKHKPILIRKVPRNAVSKVISELEQIELPKGVKVRWRETEKRLRRADVVDVVGEFTNQSTSLKALSSIIFNDHKIAEEKFEKEVGQIPYMDEPDWKPWGGNWDRGLNFLLRAFETERARSYAYRDVLYTYRLWQELGSPACGDDDSELSCLIGAMHWYGFSINQSRILPLLEHYKQQTVCPINPNSPIEVVNYLKVHLDATEQLVVKDAKRTTLEELRRWDDHPIKPVVENIIQAKQAYKRLDLLRKLRKAGRFCFTMKVQGTLSNRMAGGSEEIGRGMSIGHATKLNAQGVPREKEIRSLFTLAYSSSNTASSENLEGGDFDALEVTIADAVYQDEQLRQDLNSSIKIHAITGSVFYGCTPEKILDTRGTINDRYVRSKNAFFGWLYGAQLAKVAKVLDLTEEQTTFGLQRLIKRYPKIAEARKRLMDQFTPLRQEGGPGTSIEWVEPADYVESILGFRRYFTLEWSIIRGLYNLANYPPDSWAAIPGTCRRTNREQPIKGAIQSALYAAIFSLQSHVFRAAANHQIQAVGAQLNKHLTRRIWDLQPHGTGPWIVRPLNVHDENQCPVKEGYTCKERVNETVEEMKKWVPLISLKWKTGLKSWADK